VSDLRDVRAFAARFPADEPRLDVLVNNAGVLPAERALSADGNELALATNVLGPFLLTNLLIPLLTASAPARVINVSSGGMYTQRLHGMYTQRLHVEDLQSTGERFDGLTVYARTKRAQVILTELWARRLAGTRVVVHAMHPGWVDTPGVASSLPRFHRLTLAAPLPPADRTAAAQPRTGGRHDCLARRGRRAGREFRRLLARPPTAPDAPPAMDHGDARRSRAALARVRAPHRLACSPAPSSHLRARIEPKADGV
jgi:dehydrogenase/reductase SDR family member 12